MEQKQRLLSKLINLKSISFLTKNFNSLFFVLLLFLGLLCGGISFLNDDIPILNRISSLLFAFSFIMVFIWFIFSFIESFIRRSISRKFYLFLFVLFIFFISIFNVLINTPFSFVFLFNYYKKIILTFSVLVFIVLVSTSEFDFKIQRVLRLFYFVLALTVLFSYFYGIGKNYMHQSSKEMLRLTFGNSNAAGIVLVTVLCIGVYSVATARKFAKILYFIPIAPLLYLLYLTRCRSAIVSLIIGFSIFAVFSLVSLSKRPLKNRLVFSIITACCFFPIVFSSTYLVLGSTTDFLDRIVYMFGGSGKTADSRMEVLTFSFQTIFKNPIFGHYFSKERINFAFGYQCFQIEWFIEEGFVPSICLIFLLIFILYQHYFLGKNIFYKINTELYLPIVLIIVQIFIGTFESGMFIGMSGWYLFAFCFLAKFTKNRKDIFINSHYFEVKI